MDTTETEECMREDIMEHNSKTDMFQRWVDEGISKGFILWADCATHGSIYTEEDEEEFDAGTDPCRSVLVVANEYQ